MHGEQGGVYAARGVHPGVLSLPFEYKIHPTGHSRLFIVSDPRGVYDPGAGKKLMDCVGSYADPHKTS